jgi:uncharacterized repeat protein (TIGR01451 family)
MSLVLSLVALAALLLTQLAAAHPVVVDGQNTPVGGQPEWFGAGPRANTGTILRNAAQQGEFAWKDRPGDVRLGATDTFTKAVDLISLRVTADPSKLYVQAVFDAIAQSTPAGKLPQLQIAIDTGAGGATTLVDPSAGVAANTAVAPGAAWEYLYQTQFDHGLTAAPKAFSGASGTPVAVSTGATAALTYPQSNLAEIGIPWSELGGAPGAGGRRLRFTVAVLRADGTVPSDGATSAVVDAVSPLATFDEVTDGVLDGNGGSPAAFDVNFDAQGEVFSPLLISEFVPNPFGSNTAQWVEIANASAGAVDLSGYKIGDETTRGGFEGMYRMPAISLPAGAVILFTRSKASFGQLGYALPQGARLYEFSQLTPYTNWATNAEGFNLKDKVGIGGTGSLTDYSDEVVVLDAGDTIADILQYTSPNPPSPYPDLTPIIVPASGVPEDLAFQRCPYTRDTNDTALDVVSVTSRAQHTPGVPCADTQVDLGIAQTGPSTGVSGSTVAYVLRYGNTGVGATSVLITDTLPLGAAYAGEAATPPVALSTGDATSRTWALPKLPFGATGVITVSVTLPAALGPVTNHVVIGNAQPERNPANNASDVTTTVAAAQSPDLLVSKALHQPRLVYTGGQAVYTITYSNTGDLAAQNVSIVDTFPASLTNPSVSGCAAPVVGSGTASIALGTLQPGATGTCTITFTVIGAGGTAMDNQVAISTSTPENNTANNSFTLVGQVQPRPPIDLSISKLAESATVALNGTLRYTITIRNSSFATQTASGIVVSDPLPPGMAYVAGSTSGANEPAQSGGALTWTLPPALNLAPGASATFSFRVSLPGALVNDSYTNSATVSGGGAAEPVENLADNTATSGPTTVGRALIYLALVKRA